MSRRIVFAGGTQTRALAKLYRGEVAGAAGDDVVFIGTGAVGSDQARSTLLLADVLVMEVDEDGDAIPAADLPTRADLVRVPNLYVDFLWPFAGGAHPKNRGAFVLPGGPYPAEHGDRFLDKMVAEGVAEQAAIKRYLAMNIVVDGELDSRLTDRLAIQQKLDRAGGYDLAGYIGDNFRSEKLFNTRQRLTMPMLRRLVEQLFPKLGARDFDVGGLRRVPFPAGAQPVHPGVAAHFGLSWAGPDTRYPLNEEGSFTFEEFCGRYMRFAWNETLHRGIQTAKSRPADAVADLESGLAESPESPLGRLALVAARHAAGLAEQAPGRDDVIDEDSYAPGESAPAAVVAASADPEPVAAHAAPEEAPAPLIEEESAPEPIVAPEAAAAPVAESAAPDAGLVIDHDEDALIAEAAPEPPAPEPEPVRVTRFGAPPKPATAPPAARPEPLAHGFTDFAPKPPPAEASDIAHLDAGDDLIDVLPRLLPVFRDLSSAADRPFDLMPEVMPPPPLRPILPPEIQGEEPKQGFLARMLGRKSQ